MKPRRWVIVFFLLLLAGAGTLYFGVRALEHGKKVERFLTEHISPLIGGTFNVESIRIGFLSIYLSKVQVSLPLRGVTLTVGDIKIGFSLWKFLRSRGDPARSIGKFILIRPRVDISLHAGTAPDSQTMAPLPSIRFFIRDFPVEQLLVQKGEVAVVDAGGERIVIGDQLDGRIFEQPGGVTFDMKGKMASKKRNLSLSGFLSTAGERHRLSLRIDRARIDRTLRVKSVAVTDGILDGACEIFFSDTVRPENIESRGWVHITEGICRVQGIAGPIKPISASLTLAGFSWQLDSLRCGYGGMLLAADGVWHFAGGDTSKLAFSCQGIQLDSLAPALPSFITRNILGAGWISGNAAYAPGSPEIQATVHSGGFTLWGLPLAAAEAQSRIAATGMSIDSLRINCNRLQISANGSIGYGDSISYACNFAARMDSFPGLPDLRGRFECSGTVGGIAGRPLRCTAAASARGVSIGSVVLGTLRASIMSADNRCTFEGSSEDKISLVVGGSCDSMGNRHPRFSCSVSAGGYLSTQIADLAPAFMRDEMRAAAVNGTLSGPLPELSAQASIRLRGGLAGGLLSLTAHSPDIVTKPVFWQMRDDRLSVSGNAFPLVAAGAWRNDSLHLDSLIALNGLRAAGLLTFAGGAGTDIQCRIDSVSLSACNAWFTGGKGPFHEGFVSGNCRITGTMDMPALSAQLHFRRCNIGGFTALSTDVVITGHGDTLNVLPAVVRKDDKAIITVDTLRTGRGRLWLSGSFDRIDARMLLGAAVLEENEVAGSVRGTFATASGNFPVHITAYSPEIKIDNWKLDSVSLAADVDTQEIAITGFHAADGRRSAISGSGIIPWTSLDDRADSTDTASVSISVKGDLLATAGANLQTPVGGKGKGEIVLALIGSAGEWHIARALASIPQGTLTVKPFVAGNVENFSLSMTMNDSGQIDAVARGMIKRRLMTISTSHSVPQGYEPIRIGLLDLGVIQVRTPEQGVELHFPGFMAIGDIGTIEFTAKAPYPALSISGPANRPRITGTMVVRSVDFTFPLLTEEPPPMPEDPTPYVNWELDIKPGDRKVGYYYDLRGKRRKLIRFFDATVDQSSNVLVRGCLIDQTFRLYGGIKSARGAVYFTKVFDRNLDVGLEFAPQPLPAGQGYDNMPIMHGKAETFSDSSRFNRISLTLKVADPVTGAISEKGRIALVPAGSAGKLQNGAGADSVLNISFQVSSNFEEIAGESERELLREAGLQFTTLEGASGFVSNFGEQYLHRYFLQRFERRLAKALGLDVISVETSIASNYFYYLQNRHYNELWSQWNLLANMGVTVGRYFFNDYFFVKARGGLVPGDTLLRPEYSVGLEFMPTQFLMMDVNYGFSMKENNLQPDPRVQLQLQLPITNVRKWLDF